MSPYLFGVLTLPLAALLLVLAWFLLSLMADYGVRIWQVFGHESKRNRRARWGAMVATRRSVWGLRVGRRTAIVFLPLGDTVPHEQFSALANKFDALLQEAEGDS